MDPPLPNKQQEQIADLLNPTNNNLAIRDDMRRGVYVENLTERPVINAAEAAAVLTAGAKNRHVDSTNSNERSSRSHSVFIVSLESVETRAECTQRRFAKLSLVDLAGSERQKKTETAGARLKVCR